MYVKMSVVSRRHLHRGLIAVAALVAAAAVVLPGSGGGTPGPTMKPAVRAAAETPAKYVALGSSYASGPDASPGPEGGCLRTADNYPHQVARARHMQLVDATCSGATTANIVSVPQKFMPSPQIDAVTRDTALVTITTGGNDIGYIARLITMSCQTVLDGIIPGTAPRGCAFGREPAPEPGPARYAAVQREIVDTIHVVRQRAPRAEVVLVDYPPAVVAGGLPCALLPLNPDQIAETVRIFDALAAATARAAQETGATLVKASRAGAAHTVCSAQPWLRGFAPPIPYHPDEAGKTGVADLVVDALGGPRS